MKNLLWGLFAFATLAHAQGTVTDIDGNTYDYLTYGTQQWTVEHAAMETYRDGTPIPQVTDATQWSSLTTGAWCYYDNDPTKGKLYNWYAVAGINDNDPNTPNKEFAPTGWHVPTYAEWTTLEEYLIANGYNYDGTTTGNKIAKSMASISGWISSSTEGSPGNDQSLNNSSGFNAFPVGVRNNNGSFSNEGMDAFFWSSTEYDTNQARISNVPNNYSYHGSINPRNKKYGFSVRFVRESNTCSEVSINASSTEVCIGESVDLSVDGLNSSSGVNTQSHSFTTGNYTRIPYTPHLYNLPQSTIEFWYYQESSSEEFIVATEYFNTGWGFHVENNGGSPRFLELRVSNGAARLGFDIPVRYEIPFNQWIHVAGVHDGSTVYLYVDGNLIDSAPYTGQIGDSYEDIVINRHTWASGSSERLNGKIDELRISNIARYTSNFTPPLYEFSNDSNTLALWHFNGNMQDESQYNTQSVTNGTNFSSNVPFGSYNFNSTDLLWSTGDTTETISVTPTETTEYWVDVTTNGVTCREYITINVTAPAAPTGDSEETFCDTATIADLTATGDNIQWYDAATGGNLLDTTSALTDGQMVYASQTVNGCESTDRLEVSVLVQEITITASASEVCTGESVDLTVSSGLTTNSTTGFTANLQNGLVAYWPFSGNANDESGNGNNGTVNGATLTTDRFGNVNSAYYFSSAGCATRIDADIPQLQDNQNGFTISFWVMRTGNGCIQPRLWELWGGSKTQQCKWVNGASFLGSDGLNTVNTTLNDDIWYNICFTTDGITQKVFVNGSFNNSQPVQTSHPNNGIVNSTDFAMGRMNHPAWDAFNGKLDDFALWNRALSETEVQQLAGAPSYNWSTGDTTENITVTPTETTEYWVDVTTNGVTCREYVTINVTAPAAPTGDAEQTFCDTTTVADLSATGDNIQWFDAATGGNLLDSTTALTDGQTVYASQTVNGCESTDRLAVTVSIQEITITATATEVCAGESVDLTVSSGLTAGTTACTSADLPANLQTGLVGYWPFCGNANDESGNGNNGTVNGATLTTDRFGNPDSAYSFDGVNDYISLNDTFFNGSSVTELTHSLWFNVTNYPANGSYSFSTKEGYWRTISFALTTNNQIRFGGSQPSPQQYFNIYSPQNIVPMNSWNNITVTYQNSTLKLYLNGSLVATETIALSSLNYSYLAAGNSTSTNLIGASHPVSPGLTNFVDGKIDDFTLWNRALTEAEVQQLAGAPSYNWSTGDTTENITVTPTETTEYWVDVTTNGVTCREYVTINVTAPAAPTGDAEQTFCDTTTVADLSATGDNIQWFDAATGGNLLDSTTALTDGQTVYASQTVNGCESTDRLAVTVSIQDITITASATEVCAGESVDLTVSSGLTAGTTACTSADLPANLQTGLVGYWPFCGNANDESGNGNNGTVNGATLTTDRFGNPDSAYSFDGDDDFINIGNNEDLNFNNNFSISCFINVNSTDSSDNIIINNEGLYEIGLTDLNNTLKYAISNDNPGWSWQNITPIGNNQWYLITLTYNQGEINFYLDGALIYTYQGSGALSDFHPGLDDLRFGGRMFEGISSFNGSIDNIAMWNLALTGTEVQQLANSSTYTWSTGDTTETISVTPTETTEYWVDVTTNGVTCREYVTITVNDLPEAPTGETVNYFINCDSFSPTLNDVIATLNGDNIKLYDADVGGNLLDPNSNILDGQVVYASQTLDSCESSDRLEVQLNLYTLDTPTTAAPNNTVSFCNEQNLTILDLAPAQTATDRLWYETATSTTPIPETTPLVDGVTYYVSNYNLETGCESDRLAMTVEINNPEAPTGDAVQSFCDNVTVSDLSASGSNIQWYDAATGGNVLDPSSALSDGQLLYASQTENNCESLTRLEVSVEIDIIPDPILITTELEFCLAREATLADLEVDEQGFALEWYDSFSGGNMLPMDTLLEDGVSYYATLYDAASGCESLMRLEVVPTVIPCEVVIYNAISLNDNGINDHMVIENAEYFPDNSLEVYNRDGHLLYSQTQYGIGDNLFRGVANVSGIYGTTLSGDGPRLPTGSYLYVFKYFNPYEQQQYTLKGFLTINSN